MEVDENQIAVSVQFNYTSLSGEFISDYENTVEDKIFQKQNKLQSTFTDYKTEMNWSMTINDGMIRIDTFIILSGDTTLSPTQYSEQYNNYVAETRILLSEFLMVHGITSYLWDLHYTFGVFSFEE